MEYNYYKMEINKYKVEIDERYSAYMNKQYIHVASISKCMQDYNRRSFHYCIIAGIVKLRLFLNNIPRQEP